MPLPNTDTDWIIVTAGLMLNQFQWSQDKELRNWIASSRLDGFSKMVQSVDPEDAEKMAILMRMRDSAMPALVKLQQFIAEINEQAA